MFTMWYFFNVQQKNIQNDSTKACEKVWATKGHSSTFVHTGKKCRFKRFFVLKTFRCQKEILWHPFWKKIESQNVNCDWGQFCWIWELELVWDFFQNQNQKESQKITVISFEGIQKISNLTKYGGRSLKIKPAMPILSSKFSF